MLQKCPHRQVYIAWRKKNNNVYLRLFYQFFMRCTRLREKKEYHCIKCIYVATGTLINHRMPLHRLYNALWKPFHRH